MDSPKAYLRRLRSVGWPVLLTGFALLFAAVALVLPVWTFQQDSGGGDLDKWTYGWTSVAEDEWRNGVFAGTTITPYTSPTFDQFRLREAMGTVYLVGMAYLLMLGVLGGVHYVARTRLIPRSALLVANLLASAVGVITLVLPMALIPPAAAVDANGVISGFGGQATVLGDVITWGAGAAWWLWIASVFLSLIVLAIPWLIRTPRIQPTPAQ